MEITPERGVRMGMVYTPKINMSRVIFKLEGVEKYTIMGRHSGIVENT